MPNIKSAAPVLRWTKQSNPARWISGRWIVVQRGDEFYLGRPGWTVSTFRCPEDAKSAAGAISRRIGEPPPLRPCDHCAESIEDVPRTRCEDGQLLCESCCVYICDICMQHWCGDCLCDLDHEHIEDWEPIRECSTARRSDPAAIRPARGERP